jgi:HK97 family phage major capsid protein
MVKLSAKKLKAVVPISRELMMTSSFSADQMFARDLMNQMRLGLDYGVLFGSGGEFQPLGLVNTKGIQVIDIDKPSTVKPGWVDAAGKITPDFINELYGILMQKNVNGNKLGWTFPPMLMVQIGNMKTTTGAYIYRDEMNRGTLLGFPFKTTTQIPLTGSIADDTGKTSIIFGDWADVIIGEMSGMQTETTTEGTWEDENGGLHNAFNEDAAATKALMYVDSALRYTESFVHVKNVPV